MKTRLKIRVKVNGETTQKMVESRLLLVDYLREELGLTGTHVGCDTSNCGACTVIMDGRAVKSCTVLAVQADRREVTTIEGLARRDQLHVVQKAFWEHQGLQCGFCTPGMIMAAVDLLGKNATPTDSDVRSAIAGNLCRCTGYNTIVESILAAAVAMREGRRTVK